MSSFTFQEQQITSENRRSIRKTIDRMMQEHQSKERTRKMFYKTCDVLKKKIVHEFQRVNNGYGNIFRINQTTDENVSLITVTNEWFKYELCIETKIDNKISAWATEVARMTIKDDNLDDLQRFINNVKFTKSSVAARAFNSIIALEANK